MAKATSTKVHRCANKLARVPPEWCPKSHPHRGRHIRAPAPAKVVEGLRIDNVAPAPVPSVPPARALAPTVPAELVVDTDEEERAVRLIARDELRRARAHLLTDLGATVLEGVLSITEPRPNEVRVRVGDHDVAHVVAARHRNGQRVTVLLVTAVTPEAVP